MAEEIEVQSVSFPKPLLCSCGRPFSKNDARVCGGDILELVCSVCHETAARIECRVRGNSSRWY